MKYRIITMCWILFIIISGLYIDNYLKVDEIKGDANLVLAEDVNPYEIDSEKEPIYLEELPNYGVVEYFLIDKGNLGEINIYGNNKYYEELNLKPPTNNQYYGNTNVADFDNIGSGAYIDLGKKISYFNLDLYKGSTLPEDKIIYFRSEDKNLSYETEKKIIDNGDYVVENELNKIPFISRIFIFLMNLFFIILILLFLIVDINLYNKELSIRKILGYNLYEAIKYNFSKQLIYSLAYFLLMIVPLSLIYFDKSPSSLNFFIVIFYKVLKIYIISNIIYLFIYIYNFLNINTISVIKGKMNSEIINFMGESVNILSKILIIIVLSVMIIPLHQTFTGFLHYNKYIKNNENFVEYNVHEEMLKNGMSGDFSNEYEKLNENGAIINSFFNTGYTDSPEFLDNEIYNQYIVLNSNYLELIKFPETFEKNKNFLLIPNSMSNSTKAIEENLKERYSEVEYDKEYYENQKIYTYLPTEYLETNGYVYSPIIFILNDASKVFLDPAIAQNIYYRSDNLDGKINLIDDFTIYFSEVKAFLAVILMSFLLFASLIVISSYYTVTSYLQINGKEIGVKRILGYSRISIYKKFYILDFIFYICGSILIYSLGSKYSVPLYFIAIFIIAMILLNEYNKRFMINRVEKSQVINIIKGEV